MYFCVIGPGYRVFKQSRRKFKKMLECFEKLHEFECLEFRVWKLLIFFIYNENGRDTNCVSPVIKKNISLLFLCLQTEHCKVCQFCVSTKLQ